MAPKYLALSLLWWSTVVHAQAQLVPKDDALKGAGSDDVPGWNSALAAVATVNLVSNSAVVGQVDGFSALFGLGLVGGADYMQDSEVFRGALSISESFARTPVVHEFVKTNDVVKLDGLYNHFLAAKLGLYGRLGIQTAMFAADDVRGVATTWVEKGDVPRTLTVAGFRQRLASRLSPFTLDESAGVFADPYTQSWLALALRAGFAGRHTFADHVRILDDDKATPEVELQALRDVHQLGLEAFAGVTGKVRDGKLAYRAGVSILVPAVNNDKDDRSAGALTRVGFESAVTFQLYEWMSLVYSLTITRDPQLFARGNELTQVQNSLLVTWKYAFIQRHKRAAEPTAAERELAVAKQRAEAADAARRAAEARVRELEQQLGACELRCGASPGAGPSPAAGALPPPSRPLDGKAP